MTTKIKAKIPEIAIFAEITEIFLCIYRQEKRRMVVLIRNPAIISFTMVKKKACKQESSFSPANIFNDND